MFNFLHIQGRNFIKEGFSITGKELQMFSGNAVVKEIADVIFSVPAIEKEAELVSVFSQDIQRLEILHIFRVAVCFQQRSGEQIAHQQGQRFGGMDFVGVGDASEAEVPQCAVGPISPVDRKVDKVGTSQPNLKLAGKLQVGTASAAADVDVKVPDFKISQICRLSRRNMMRMLREPGASGGVRPKPARYSGSAVRFS